jgi:hypothetical protein
MVGDDFSNTPPAHALTRRGIVGNIRGYMLYGDYREASPASDIVRAVERDNQQLLKDVDRVLARRSGDLRHLLEAYHVPLVRPAN